MMVLKSATLLVTLLTALAILGLAVPNITVNVQEVGSGGCWVESPVQWATIILEWSKSGSLIQTWSLSGASVIFSNDINGPVNFTVIMRISGYSRWYDSNPSVDIVKGVLSTPSGVVAGHSYSLTLNDTPSYDVSPLLGIPEPETLNATGIVMGGSTSCNGIISLLVKGIGIGSTSYSPPPVAIPTINVTINNTGNPELRDYVVNFTVSSSCIPILSKVYITDSSGNPLYFWAFNDSANNKIWFWVNYTVPANSVSNITIHLNGTGASPYFDPNRVFWNFTENLSVSQFSLWGIYVNVSKMGELGYSGYAVDSFSSLDISQDNYPGPMFLTFYRYNGGTHYFYGLGINYWISFSTFSLSFQLGSVILSGSSLNQLNLQSYTVFNDSVSISRNGLYSIVADNSTKSIGLYLNGTFIDSTSVDPQGVLILPIIGQYYADSGSHYYWIGVRPYLPSVPKVSVPPDCAAPGGEGDYTFTLYFRS